MNGKPLDYGTAQETAIREDEVLVPDLRAQLRPAEMVERKLVALLKTLPLPASYFQQARLRRPAY